MREPALRGAFRLYERPARADTLRLTTGVRLPRFATATGRRLFLPVSMERWRVVLAPPRGGTRTQPVEFFPYPFEDVDTLVVALPSGYRVESNVPPVVVETPFASYALTVTHEGQTLRTVRRLVARQTRLGADDYAALRTFLQRVTAGDNARVVLVRE